MPSPPKAFCLWDVHEFIRVYLYSWSYTKSLRGRYIINDVMKLILLITYTVSQKSSPPKTSCNIFTEAKYISVKFCRFVASIYPHRPTNFGWFTIIFNKMALFFLRVLIVFTLSSFELLHCVSKISPPSCLRYNVFDPNPILIIFGRIVSKGNCNVKMLTF